MTSVGNTVAVYIDDGYIASAGEVILSLLIKLRALCLYVFYDLIYVRFLWNNVGVCVFGTECGEETVPVRVRQAVPLTVSCVAHGGYPILCYCVVKFTFGISQLSLGYCQNVAGDLTGSPDA